MRETEDIMGMPVSVEISDGTASRESLEKAFDYFRYIDATFSTYKKDSEISRMNRGELLQKDLSDDVKCVLRLAEETKQDTHGYFDVRTPEGTIDPSGLVKGWAILNAAQLLRALGHGNFYVEAGGDIQTGGKNAEGKEWRIGVRNPFNRDEIIKVVYPRGKGVATSGTAIRGQHIYDPHAKSSVRTNIVSLTVIGPNVYEADRFATAAYAMGERGIGFIEELDGFEGYAVDAKGTATMTSGFDTYTYDKGD